MKKILLVTMVLLLAGMVFATDYNYSKTINPEIDLNIVIDNNTHTVKIQANGTEYTYDTQITATHNIKPLIEYEITKDNCPVFEEITQPIIDALEVANIEDLNSITQYIKDANDYSNECSRVMDEKVGQLDNSMQTIFQEFKEFAQNTIAPTQDEFEVLDEALDGCRIDLNSMSADRRICLADVNALRTQFSTCKAGMVNVQNSGDNLILILVLVVVIVGGIAIYFIGKEEGWWEKLVRSEA